MKPRCAHIASVLLGTVAFAASSHAAKIPVINGGWWQIAEESPDVSPYNTAEANACDFTIFPAEDGTWQLISCIRSTSYPGSTRLFYRWESDSLTKTMWSGQGIFLTTDMSIHTSEGRLQAPHGFKADGQHWLFYNNSGAYAMTSADGKNWSHAKDYQGNYKFFDMSRDVDLFDDRANSGKWIAYYTSNSSGGIVGARTAENLSGPWSAEFNAGGSGNIESPFVVKRGDEYFMWRQSSVYRSSDPMHFPDAAVTVTGPKPGISMMKWAPEVVSLNGQDYIAAYSRGIHMAKITWMDEVRSTLAAFNFNAQTATPDVAADGLTVSSLTAAAGATGTATTIDPGYAFYTSSFGGATEAAAVAGNDYFEITLTPDQDATLDVSMLSMYVSGQLSGPMNWFLRSSLDGFTQTLASDKVNGSSYYVDLTQLPTVSDPITFRIYGYGALGTGRMYVDDLTVDGVVTVPEPAGVAVVVLAGVALLRRGMLSD